MGDRARCGAVSDLASCGGGLKAEIFHGGMPASRLEWHLANWKRFMHSGHLTDGYPQTAAGCVGGGYSTSFEDMCDSADSAAAEAIGALIESLTPIQSAAINHRWLRAVYKFPRGNYDTSLLDAMDILGAGMLRRGFY